MQNTNGPRRFLREVTEYVSGDDWQAYDDPVGQPIYYPGFTEHIKSLVLGSEVLRDRMALLAEQKVQQEERDGRFRKEDKEYHIKKVRRRSELEGQLRETADAWVDQMICKFESKWFIRGAYYLASELLTRAYHQGIHVSSEDVVMLRQTAERAAKLKQSIVFLPCHKSHVDYVSLQVVCYRLGIALPIVVAGDNLNFPLVGSFLQNAGAMWIRRSFGDDQLYSALVQAYIDTLLQNGHNLECFIEGGRSRTGKLLPPKFGFLGYIIDSVLSGRTEDVLIMPVSAQYDKVIETEGYVTELLGMPKKKENLMDFMTDGSSVLSLRLGRVDIRLHKAWSLREFFNDEISKLGYSSSISAKNIPVAERQKITRTLGYRVLGQINDVSVIMPTALVGTILLTLRGRGVGIPELVRRVEWLAHRIRAKGGRVAHLHGRNLEDVVLRALDVLGKNLAREVQDLLQPTYFAEDRFQLSYYRNMTIHLFITEALVCAAMYTRIKQGGGPSIQDIDYQELRAQVLFLSTLFRGEFIFPSEGLEANLEKSLQRLETDGVINLSHDEKEKLIKVGLSDAERRTGRENYDFYCFLIWPFIEAAWLASVSLFCLTPPSWVNEEVWLEVSKVYKKAQLVRIVDVT
jgi:glycerol-3-phosphate O-acyltransferase